MTMFRMFRKVVLVLSCSDEDEVKKEDLIDVCKVLSCRDMEVFVEIGEVHYNYPK